MLETFGVLLRRELSAVLLSPIAYVLLVAFGAVTGCSFLFSAAAVSQEPTPLDIMQVFFWLPFFWFCLMITIPILTMRSFSEEYRSGTIEMLMTAPVREWEVLASKFTASFGVYLFLWIPSLLYYLSFQWITGFQFPVHWGPLLLSYAFVMLVGMFYTSIGVFASSLTQNQIVAAIISFSIIMLIFFDGFLPYFTTDPGKIETYQYFSVMDHIRDFSRGRFDTRPVVLYFSGTFLFLFFTHLVLMSRKLKA